MPLPFPSILPAVCLVFAVAATAETPASSVFSLPKDASKLVTGALLDARTLNGISVEQGATGKTLLQVEGLSVPVLAQWSLAQGREFQLDRISLEGYAFKAQPLQPETLIGGVPYSRCLQFQFSGRCAHAELYRDVQFRLQVLGPLSSKRPSGDE